MDGASAPTILPPGFQAWFDQRGWRPRRHQLAMVEKGLAGRDALLIAPTGGGKTLAGFLPSLIELSQRPPRNAAQDRPGRGVHTLYLSPLKALAVDVHRNLEIPIAEMKLGITVEARTGDTPQAKRVRQRLHPPDMLLTTPEQLALFCAWDGARAYFADLSCVIIDEIHAIHGSKRGDLLSLGLARLSSFAPGMRRVGLSATVNDPDMLRRWLAPAPSRADLVQGDPGAPPLVEVLVSQNHVPWSGWTARHALEEVYQAIQATRTALIFVNTRFQAELAFQALWEMNDENLPIALHHGSLAAEQRRRVEAAMSREELRAVVCTSTLDLGIDWGSVDLVIQLAAPKGSSRLVQRIGRANHRLDEPSRALLVPAHRFEFLECEAARQAVEANDLDGEPARIGAQDILAQHVMGVGCGEPFDLAALYAEVITAAPFADLTWEDFEGVVDYVATGGYALRSYDRFARLVKVTSGPHKGKWKARTPEIVARHRMNVGAIIEIPVLSIRVASSRGQKRVGGRKIGEMEESFLEQLSPGDCFLFAGQVWRFETITGLDALVTAAPGQEARTPSWGGSKFALSTYLAARVRRMIADQSGWPRLPNDVREWLEIQRLRSLIPSENEMLVETFQRGKRHFLVAYPFDGRISHGTLCQLLARRLERLGKQPLGFVANDYALAVWALKPMADLSMAELFQEDMLGDDLEAWLDESFMMKRAFRHCAMISGLIQRRQPGAEKSNRQVTFSTDLIYDVLRRHQPDHLLLRCARSDAAQGVLDVARLGRLLQRIKGRITAIDLPRVSPFAVPVLLEIGRETVAGAGAEALLQETADELIADAMALDDGALDEWSWMSMRWVRVRTEVVETGVVLARSDCGDLWVELMGLPVCLRPSGALWIEAEGMLVAGDLHLEKGSSYARGGQLLPPYDTPATLDRLEAEIARLDPRVLVLLGDSFHDPRALGRLHPDDARRLAGFAHGRTLVWAEGNHDTRRGETALGGLPGEVADEVRVGPLVLRHEPLAGVQPGEVSGHLHPCAKVVASGRGVRRRVFATDGRRLILPAFGAYAGGLNVCDPAFTGLFAAPPLVGALGDGRVHPIPFAALCGD